MSLTGERKKGEFPPLHKPRTWDAQGTVCVLTGSPSPTPGPAHWAPPPLCWLQFRAVHPLQPRKLAAASSGMSSSCPRDPRWHVSAERLPTGTHCRGDTRPPTLPAFLSTFRNPSSRWFPWSICWLSWVLLENCDKDGQNFNLQIIFIINFHIFIGHGKARS